MTVTTEATKYVGVSDRDLPSCIKSDISHINYNSPRTPNYVELFNTFSGKQWYFPEKEETPHPWRKWRSRRWGVWIFQTWDIFCAVFLLGAGVHATSRGWIISLQHVLIYCLLLFPRHFQHKPTLHCIEIAASSRQIKSTNSHGVASLSIINFSLFLWKFEDQTVAF